MSKEKFDLRPSSGKQVCRAIPETGENSCGCVLDLAYDLQKETANITSWSTSLKRGLRKSTLAFSNFLRECVLSAILLIGFFVWSLIIPRESKNQSLLACTCECVGKLAKRSLDIVGATISLILSLPLFMITAILIKLDSPGPVFFKQERIGQNRRSRDRRNFNLETEVDKRRGDKRRVDCFGKPFKVYKFRTMVDNAEKVCGPVWAKKDDPRITSVGRILRHTRLDELPQLMNVLKGEMSLVGPRPERYFFIKNLASSVQQYPKRLSVKPGITGLAQVKNGYDSNLDDVRVKIVYDLDYIRNWSILKDLKILAQTVVVMLTGRGAF
ncbi:MAG: sugar transferase [candidate division Zixibacteria bacterium]|nr:sugar transferase [candidate division Zixibacteria bacterium]